MATQATQQNRASKPLIEILTDALETTKRLELKSQRADAVRLAVQTLLLMRGALHPRLFKGDEKLNPYPTLAKYVRASNAETLGALVDDVLWAISPNFITLQPLGELAQMIYQSPDDLEHGALSLLQEETIPLIIFMKKIYQESRGFDEADEDTGEGEA